MPNDFKKLLIAAFILQLEHDLAAMKESARATHEAATHEESKPENEYDTRGLEAAYLAGAQAKRAGEIDEVLALFKSMSFKAFQPNDPVQASALIDVKIDGKPNRLLMMPKGGAVRLQFQGETIQIVTPASSLGEALLGQRAGEMVEFEVGDQLRECELIAVQ
jgi:hypothetical protein